MRAEIFPNYSDWPALPDDLKFHAPDLMELIRKGMKEILEKGDGWRRGEPTDAEKMAIFVLAGVPVRFEGLDGTQTRIVTACRCGLIFTGGKYTVGIECTDRGHGTTVKFPSDLLK